MLAFVTSLLLTIAAEDVQTSPGLRFVSPEDYAIRRFNEVTEEYLSRWPDEPQDLLIRKRALLAIAEEKLEEERQRTNPAGLLSRDHMIRAAEAQADYYKKQIQSLERRIRQRRR